MNFMLLSLSLASVFALGQCLTACRDLPKVKHDASKTLGPLGDKWKVVRSNAPDNTEKCTSFEYIGGRNGKMNYASGLFIQRKETADLDTHTVYTLRVNNQCDQWRGNTLDAENPMPMDMKFRKMWIDYEKQAFCIYACDEQEEKTIYYSCMTTNMQGWKAITEAEKSWDIDLSAEVEDVWDVSCENDRATLVADPIGMMEKGDECPLNEEEADEGNIGVDGKPDPA